MPAAPKRILCIDVGGSGLKAAIISPRGKYLVKRHRIKTPKHRKPRQIVKVLAGVPGVTDLGLIESLGQPSLRITPDRERCARYNLNTGDVATVIQAAIGGQAVTQVHEGEMTFDLTVLWNPQFRESLDAIRQMIPSAKDMSDQEIVTWVGDSTQCLRDLLDVFIDPETRLLRVSAAEFLVLRGATLGDGVPRITVSEEAPASVVVGFPGDDHGMAGAVWMVDRQSARDLAAVLREQLGEPDMDMAASAEGTEHMMEAFQENTVHTHKE